MAIQVSLLAGTYEAPVEFKLLTTTNLASLHITQADNYISIWFSRQADIDEAIAVLQRAKAHLLPDSVAADEVRY